MTGKSDSHPQDLDWTAFCYVAGELPESEAIQFEKLLDDDQAAREAVARACELSQAVSQLSPAPSSLRTDSQFAGGKLPGGKRSPRRGWHLVAAGLALTALVALFSNRGTQVETTERSRTDRLVSYELASLWVTTGARYTDLTPAAAAANNEETDPLLAELPALAEAEADQELAPPSWMIAAVAGLDSEIAKEN